MNSPRPFVLADRKLTSGAKRILERLQSRLIDNAGTPLSTFQQLLHELLSEENRATELLGFSLNVAATLHDNEVLNPDHDIETLAEWLTLLLRQSDRIAIRSSVEAVTGTEHLLLAAIELDTWTQQFLENRGVDLESLTAMICPPEPELEAGDVGLIQVQPAGPGIIDEPSLHRILDASGNRCREGLRVVEDFVRFGLDDPSISLQLKELRHQITTILTYLRQETWVACRDTVHDVGTQTTTTSESYRGTAIDVVRASLKRTEEALRSLEEYSKLIDPDLSRRLEQSRYRFYTIEKSIEANINSRARLLNCRLYLLVTAEQCRYGIKTIVRDTISTGVDIVQLREKSASDRQIIDLGRRIRDWTHEQNTLFIMNDRPDLAVACGADGVHLGQDDMAIHEARKIVGSRMLIGVSTHQISQARAAIYAGADYLGAGPTFPSQTKTFQEFAGLNYLQELAAETSLPWFAIGGIDLANLGHVLQAGASRIAVSSTICAAANPRGVTRELSERLRRAAGLDKQENREQV